MNYIYLLYIVLIPFVYGGVYKVNVGEMAFPSRLAISKAELHDGPKIEPVANALVNTAANMNLPWAIIKFLKRIGVNIPFVDIINKVLDPPAASTIDIIKSVNYVMNKPHMLCETLPHICVTLMKNMSNYGFNPEIDIEHDKNTGNYIIMGVFPVFRTERELKHNTYPLDIYFCLPHIKIVDNKYYLEVCPSELLYNIVIVDYKNGYIEILNKDSMPFRDSINKHNKFWGTAKDRVPKDAYEFTWLTKPLNTIPVSEHYAEHYFANKIINNTMYYFRGPKMEIAVYTKDSLKSEILTCPSYVLCSYTYTDDNGLTLLNKSSNDEWTITVSRDPVTINYVKINIDGSNVENVTFDIRVEAMKDISNYLTSITNIIKQLVIDVLVILAICGIIYIQVKFVFPLFCCKK